MREDGDLIPEPAETWAEVVEIEARGEVTAT